MNYKKEMKMKKDLSIDEIWGKYYKGRNNGNGEFYKNILIENYSGLIRPVAESIHRNLPKCVEIDDMISFGIFGLIDAIEDYDFVRNVKFETYAYGKIRGSIFDGIRKEDWVPQLIRYRIRQLKKAANNLEQYLRRKPDDEELIEELSKRNGEKEAKRIMKDARGLLKKVHLSLEDIEDNYLEDKNTPIPVIGAQKKDLKEILMRGFTRAEKLTILLYYYEGMNMKEIGKTLGWNESRICQMHSSIMDRLKNKLTSKRYDLEFFIC